MNASFRAGKLLALLVWLTSLVASAAIAGAQAGESPSGDRSYRGADGPHQVIGALKASLDGEPKTWYVHDGGEVSGASWTEEEPGRYNAVLTGFGSRDTRAEGSQLTISFGFVHGRTTARHAVSGADADGAAVRFIPSVDDLTEVHTLRDGELTVDRIAASNSQGYVFAGTFSGKLTDADGTTVGELTNGTFEVEEATPVEPDPIPPSSRR